MNLKKNATSILLLCAATVGLVLSGCGSSNSPASLSTTGQAQSTDQVYGVAMLGTTATGTVSAKDSSVPVQEKTAAISSNGSYTVDVRGLNPPYILKAQLTDSSGTTEIYSVAQTGGRVNINPITDVAVAAAANGSNPEDLYKMPDRDMYRRTAQDFDSIISKLQTVLAPLFALYHVAGNPATDDEDGDDDNSSLRAMLHDVRIVVSSGTVIVTNRLTGGVIFSGPLNDLSSGTFHPENMPAGSGGSGGSAACTSFTYSAWGACQSDSTQTRTIATQSPSGCSGGSPVLSQSCTYTPPTPACTYTYNTWGSCQSNNMQTRTMATQSPAGCTSTPVLSQPCIYVPPSNTCTSFTYSAWGACLSNNTQARTMTTQSPSGCTGGSPVLSQACTYVPPTLTITLANVTASCTGCHGLTVNGNVLASGGYTVTGRTASAWLTTINTMVGLGASLTPAGAAAQDYANFLSALASPTSSTCTSFTYSAWGTCQSNNTQTRTVATQSPTGCTGGTPVLSQSCTYVPPTNACTSFTYSAWGACQSNNTQTRTIATQSPSGCSGGSPVLSQACTYVPPTITLANVTASCTGCHGLTVNGNVFASGGYTVSGRTASAWLTTINTMVGLGASLTPAGVTAQDYANFLAALSSTPPATCSSFTYSAWGACQSNSTQTRTVATSSPTGCTGGSPVLSQACTYVPPTTTCTSFTYSAWGTCQSNNTQSRTIATQSPSGCSGGSPVLSQACTYTTPNPVTMALVQSTCTQCHGLKVNNTVFAAGGYTVSGRTASAWVSALTGMMTPPSGTTIQNFADFLVTVP